MFMKSITLSIAVLCLACAPTMAAAADGDFFVPTIDPNSVAPEKLNGPPLIEQLNTAYAQQTAGADGDSHGVGTQLTDKQVQTCAAENDIFKVALVQTSAPALLQIGDIGPPPINPGAPADSSVVQTAGAGSSANSGGVQTNPASLQTNPAPPQTGAVCNLNSSGSSSCNSCQGSSCDGNGCDNTCCGCKPWWVHVDYLALWIQGNHLPPLVTTSPDGTPRSDAGVLSNPNTTILYGDNNVDAGARNGGRVTLGYWFDDDDINGLRASWLTVGEPVGAANFFANSSGVPILARPFTSGGTPNAQLAAYTGVVMGQPGTPSTIGVTSTSSMDFAEFAFTHVYERDSGAQLSWIAGYRHLQFREKLSIFENMITTDPTNVTFPPGTALNVLDQFQTNNDFEGGELGTEFSWTGHCWTLDASTRFGLGNVHEYVNINGSTTITDPVGNVTQGPGLLAQPSNDGSYSRNVLAFLPELELNLRYQLTDQIDLSVGYTFLLITHVARVGDQIDTNVSSTDLPTANPTAGPGSQPTEVLRDTSMWAQGISGGIELRF
jgi:Putative beta barrel porin-7 (BBP7)